MFWVVSSSIVQSDSELEFRKAYIESVSDTRVSEWIKCECRHRNFLSKTVSYYICHSQKGEYGFVITAHMNLEVQVILKNELTTKKAIVVIDSCAINRNTVKDCLTIIKKKNKNSEVLFAKQEESSNGYFMSYIEDVGSFGFSTNNSERELFQKRDKGLIKALRAAFVNVNKLEFKAFLY